MIKAAFSFFIYHLFFRKRRFFSFDPMMIYGYVRTGNTDRQLLVDKSEALTYY